MSSAYGQQMTDRLLMQFANSPNLHGLLDAIGAELDLLAQVFDDLQNKRWIDTGAGAQLDGCGEIVVRPRKIDKAITIPFFGFYEQLPYVTGFDQARFRDIGETYYSSRTLGDAEYKRVLWAKVAYNTSDGTTEGTINSLVRMFNSKVLMKENGDAKIWLAIGKELTKNDIALISAINLLVRPGGVGIEFKSYFGDSVFGFSNYPEIGYKGFGEGVFARRIN
jgi:hypothetical protein